MSKKNVAFSRPEEPKFIKALKSKVGYKEPSTVDTKLEKPRVPQDDSDEEEVRKDEEPTIVVLKAGDITADEYEKWSRKNAPAPAAQNKKESAVSDQQPGGKIEFKKPVKRRSEDSINATLDCSTLKKPKETLPPRRESTSKAVKNNNLLSFDDEDEA